MTRTVLTFGLISGAIVVALIVLPLAFHWSINPDHSEVIGFTSMLLAFILVFFGVRSYRDNHAGGSISFGKAFQVGILITLVTCAVYVISWEIVFWGFMPDFGDKYAAHMIERAQKNGASAAKLDAMKADMADFVRNYKNPLYNVGMTFVEIFPLGLIVTLVSAGILRKVRTAV